MALKVLLAATLRRFSPGYDAATGIAIEMPAGTCVRDVALRLGIPEDEVRVIMVNGAAARWDTVLGADDRVAFFPAVGGG
ncbi:MAG: MoaD/ThiS family protein [Syntrophobacteraceae bacterium]